MTSFGSFSAGQAAVRGVAAGEVVPFEWEPWAAGGSPVATMPRTATTANGTGVSSGIRATRAICRKAGTYSTFTFATAHVALTGTTDIRLGVWRYADGVLLSESGNVSATVTGATNTLHSIAIPPVALSLGDELWLGVGWNGSGGSLSFQGLGAAGVSAIAGLAPQLVHHRNPWAGGASMGNLPTPFSTYQVSSIGMWAELS